MIRKTSTRVPLALLVLRQLIPKTYLPVIESFEVLIYLAPAASASGTQTHRGAAWRPVHCAHAPERRGVGRSHESASAFHCSSEHTVFLSFTAVLHSRVTVRPTPQYRSHLNDIWLHSTGETLKH